MAVDNAAMKRWVIAGTIALATTASVLAMFRVPTLAARVTSAQESGARFAVRHVAGTASGWTDETALRDLAPLFVPTERNVRVAAPAAREVDAQSLAPNAVRLGVADGGWQFDRQVPAAVTLNGLSVSRASPVDYLDAVALEGAIVGFGRSVEEIPTYQPRGGSIEIVRLRDGQRVYAESLKLEARPPTDKLWQPVEFIASIGPAGLDVPIAVSSRSGVEDVDSFYLNYLARGLRVGEFLAPGFYRITVGP